MTKRSGRVLRLALGGVLVLAFGLVATQVPAASERVVTLATWNKVPYVSESATGYAQEVVKLAFERAGYRLVLRFVPPARALYLASTGAVDGVMPIANGKDHGLALSSAFPGDHPGLLKRRNMPFALSKRAHEDRAQLWQALKPYRTGVLLGEFEELGVDKASGLRMEAAATDLLNIDKLAHKRVDLLIIDRFTAADLILRERPHLVGELQFISVPSLARSFHVGFATKRSGHAALRSAFDDALSSLSADGTIARLRARYGLGAPRPRDPSDGKLVIATVDNPDMQLMRKLSQRYELMHPGVELEWTVLDENTLRARLLGDLALDDGQYDVMTIGSFEAATWGQMEWLVPIEPIPESYDLGDLLSPVREQLTTRGVLYALPFYAEASVTFYRKDLLAAKGLTMPEKPTYADIEKFARALHDPEHDVYGICLRGQPGWGANMAFMTTLVHTAGGRWFDLSFRSGLNDAAWRRALETYQRLGRYAPKGSGEHNYVQNLELFREGKCALWIDATVALGQLFDPRHSKVFDKTGYAQAPVDVTEHGASWLWVWALGVSRASKSQTEARNFVLWATSKAYTELVVEERGWVQAPPGTRRSTYAHPSYRAAAPFAAFVRSAIERVDPAQNTREPSPYQGHYVAIVEYPALGDAVGNEVRAVLNGERSVTEALTRADLVVTTQMHASGYVQP